MKRVFLSLVVIFALIISVSSKAEAKLLPQAKGSAKQVTSSRTGGSGITVTPRLRSDRRALIVSFSNLQNAKSVTYQLTYLTNGQQEGAGGTISGAGNSTERTLLFGTCSKDVCRYHSNISNMKLEISYTSTSGKKYLKRYRVKI